VKSRYSVNHAYGDKVLALHGRRPVTPSCEQASKVEPAQQFYERAEITDSRSGKACNDSKGELQLNTFLNWARFR
jgi:hypothetical protein